MIRWFFLSAVFAISLLWLGCAQQVSPTGGPMDQTPPVVKEAFPENRSVNFTGNEITIRFNEYVTLKDQNAQIVISPPLKNTPEFLISGKSIKIKLKDTLQPNTSYAIQFGNSIADITEGNVYKEYVYAFSTGPVMDSLVLKGKVVWAESLMPAQEALVLLYASSDTSLPRTQLPVAFGKTSKDGSYTIGSLKSGTYSLYALKDVNANYFYDNPNESFAFCKQMVAVTCDTLNSGINSAPPLYLFTRDAEKAFVKSSNVDTYGHMSFSFNRTVPDLTLVPVKGSKESENLLLKKGPNKEGFEVWFNNNAGDSLHLLLSGTGLQDTLDLRLRKKGDTKTQNGSSRGGSTGSFADKLTFTPLNFGLSTFLSDTLLLMPSSPITLLNQGIAVLKGVKDSVVLSYSISNGNVKLKLPKILMGNSFYSLKLYPGVAKDFFGNTNDTLSYEIKTIKPEEYGSAKVVFTYKTQAMPGKLVLLSADNNQVYQKDINYNEEIKELTIENLTPATYKVKIVTDPNRNKRWDSGDFGKDRQPEEVWLLDENLIIKARFETEYQVKLP